MPDNNIFGVIGEVKQGLDLFAGTFGILTPEQIRRALTTLETKLADLEKRVEKLEKTKPRHTSKTRKNTDSRSHSNNTKRNKILEEEY